jgi:hypothetical protein
MRAQLAIRARAACRVYGKRLTFGGCEMSIRLKWYVKVTLAAVLWGPLVEATPHTGDLALSLRKY